jgi:uncharacterized protein
MIVPDTNLLIYAYDDSSAHHKAARIWWEQVLSGSEPVGIPWIVVLAFVRLTTHPTLNANPMTPSQSEKSVRTWLSIQQVRLLHTTYRTIDLFFNLIQQVKIGGNLTTDAIIAALSLEHGGTIYSSDLDFNRFPGVTWVNPINKAS